MRSRAAVAVLALLATASAAWGQPELQCNGKQKSWMVADLLFGRTGVNDARWSRFLAQVVTPRFPDGLTVYEARGQWRPPGRIAITRERSTVVMIAMPPGADNDRRLKEIIKSYKERFNQSSVGLIVRPACVSF
jgi:hypothetical protein